MGYGKKLTRILDEKKMSIRSLCLQCNIAPTTLYSIIKRDTNIRYDFALKIASVLNIPVSSICDTIPELNNDNSANIPASTLFSEMSIELAKLYNSEHLPILDKLISEFYVLDDESRNEILSIIDIKHKAHNDANRFNEYEKLYKKLQKKDRELYSQS